MRAYALATAFLVVFASCETQELELVPVEVNDGDGGDAAGGTHGGPDGSFHTGGVSSVGEGKGGSWPGAGGGPPATASGGERGDGGKGNGARPSAGSGGSNGAGGGPSFGGGFPGLGGSGPLDCRHNGCGFGHCAPNGDCVPCVLKEHCGPGFTCDPELYRCFPFCASAQDCRGSTPVCHPARHVCVECAGKSDCEATHRTLNICWELIGLCVGCGANADCPLTGLCIAGRCACLDDSGCEEDERCNDAGQCVQKPN